MKLNICALNTELAEAKKMLAENQPLLILGAQFYNKFYMNLVFFAASIKQFGPVTPSGCTERTIGQGYLITLQNTSPLEF